MHIISLLKRGGIAAALSALTACSGGAGMTPVGPHLSTVKRSTPAYAAGLAFSVAAPRPLGWELLRRSALHPAKGTAGTIFATGDPFSGNQGLGFAGTFSTQGQNQPQTATLTGANGAPLEQPQGLAVDRSGTLYLADTMTNLVDIYPPGATQPASEVLAQPYPSFLAVGADGTLYVSCQYTPTSSGNLAAGAVYVYPPGARTPSKTLSDPNFYQVMGVAVDSSDDVYVAYNQAPNFMDGTIAVFPAGSTKPTETHINLGSAGGLALDKAGHLLADNQNSGMQVYDPKSFTLLAQIIGGNPLGFAFSSNGKQLYVANALFDDLEIYSYDAKTFAVRETDSIYSEFWGNSAAYQPIGLGVAPAMAVPL